MLRYQMMRCQGVSDATISGWPQTKTTRYLGFQKVLGSIQAIVTFYLYTPINCNQYPSRYPLSLICVIAEPESAAAAIDFERVQG